MMDLATRLVVFAWFNFFPNRVVAVVALSLLLAASLGVLAQTIRSRAWFMLVATSVGLLEVAGFACRLSMMSNPVRATFIIMEVLLIIPPSFLALVDYIALGRLVALIQRSKNDTSKFRLKPKALTWVFFALEIASLISQGAGAGLSVDSGADGSAPPNAHAGQVLLIVGLAALVAIISFFLGTVVLVQLHPRMRMPGDRNVRAVFAGLYATVTLLLIRNIFRVIEFGQGWNGRIASTERYFYTMDTLMILLWLVVTIPLHFGVYLKRLQMDVERGAVKPQMPGQAIGVHAAAGHAPSSVQMA